MLEKFQAPAMVAHSLLIHFFMYQYLLEVANYE